MPTFVAADPKDVLIGRARTRERDLAPFVAALEDGDAGKITLEAGETISRTKNLLREASKRTGKRIRSSVTGKRTVLWRVVGT